MTNDQNVEEPLKQSNEARQRIILIEDDASLTRAYENKLTLEGFEVDIANNGSKAIEKLKFGDYNLILLDLLLPEINGFDILKQLRASEWPAAQKPVIVFSNLGNTSDIKKARELGANDYLVKASLSPNQIVEKIKEHLK